MTVSFATSRSLVPLPDTADPSSWAAAASARLVAETAPVGLLAVTSQGTLVFANGALARILGYDSADELMSEPLRRFHAHPESAVEILTERAETDDLSGVEMDLLRRDGSSVHVRINGRVLSAPDDSFMFVGSVEDVTVPREAQEEAAHSQKMEAVARFAAGVAHDYNNLLTSILGECTQVVSELGDHDPARSGVQRILQGARRAAHLTQRLLVFAKSEVVRTHTVALDDAVRALEPAIRRMLPEDVDVLWRSDGPSGPVRIAPRHLEHVVANLVTNARDAMPAGGAIVVETGRTSAPSDTEGLEFHPPVPPGEYASLAIGDRGVGMSRDTRQRVFDPFFTTKPIGDGAGLGLTTVYAMVQRAHGHVSVISAPGYGTVARVLFPIHAEEGRERIRAPGRTIRGSAAVTPTILIVDDDSTVRDVMVRFLMREGFIVLEAHDARSALEVARTQVGPLDLLVTDVMMPKVKGTELAEWICAMRPETEVLLVSGYMDSPKIQEWVDRDADIFLAKPFEPDELAARVRQRLGIS